MLESFEMLKDHEPPKESARVKAERKWTNADVRKKIIEEKNRPKPRDVDAPPEIAETIINDGKLKGPVKNLERKFLRDIRAMIEGNATNNLKHYLAFLERRRIKLLKEKLRRLQAAEQASGGSDV
jgi:hypothetical protein